MDASTYWTGRLNEYIEKLPAMLQHRNAIQHAEGVIRAYNPSECELDKLMGALKSLVGVKEAIRTGGDRRVADYHRPFDQGDARVCHEVAAGGDGDYVEMV